MTKRIFSIIGAIILASQTWEDVGEIRNYEVTQALAIGTLIIGFFVFYGVLSSIDDLMNSRKGD